MITLPKYRGETAVFGLGRSGLSVVRALAAAGNRVSAWDQNGDRRAAAEKAEATALETFEGGGTSADLPSVDIDAAKLAAGLGLLEAFVLAGLAKSNGEARRLVQGGGAKINDAAQDDIIVTLSNDDVKDGSVKLSFGKKRHVLLRPV